MAKDLIVEAHPRELTGKSNVRKLRGDGQLPGVLYGKDVSRMVTVDRGDLLRLLHAHGAHPLVTVKVDGQDYLALVKELQVDPVKLQPLHVDFYRVQENVAVQTEVSVDVVGEPTGVKDEGGILQVQLTTLVISALPRALPESLEIDVSHLALGDVARAGDIPLPDGVSLITDADETVASVTAPRVEEPAVPTAELEALADLSEEEREALAEAAEAPAEEEGPGAEASGGEAEGGGEE